LFLACGVRFSRVRRRPGEEAGVPGIGPLIARTLHVSLRVSAWPTYAFTFARAVDYPTPPPHRGGGAAAGSRIEPPFRCQPRRPNWRAPGRTFLAQLLLRKADHSVAGFYAPLPGVHSAPLSPLSPCSPSTTACATRSRRSPSPAPVAARRRLRTEGGLPCGAVQTVVGRAARTPNVTIP